MHAFWVSSKKKKRSIIKTCLIIKNVSGVNMDRVWQIRCGCFLRSSAMLGSAQNYLSFCFQETLARSVCQAAAVAAAAAVSMKVIAELAAMLAGVTGVAAGGFWHTQVLSYKYHSMLSPFWLISSSTQTMLTSGAACSQTVTHFLSLIHLTLIPYAPLSLFLLFFPLPISLSAIPSSMKLRITRAQEPLLNTAKAALTTQAC